MDPDTDVGTVINAKAASTIAGRVEAAIGERGPPAARQYAPGRALPADTGGSCPARIANWCVKRPLVPCCRSFVVRMMSRTSSPSPIRPPLVFRRAYAHDRLDIITRFVDELDVGCVNVWEVPGYRTELTPFGGIKDSGLGHKEGVLEAMKSFTQYQNLLAAVVRRPQSSSMDAAASSVTRTWPKPAFRPARMIGTLCLPPAARIRCLICSTCSIGGWIVRCTRGWRSGLPDSFEIVTANIPDGTGFEQWRQVSREISVVFERLRLFRRGRSRSTAPRRGRAPWRARSEPVRSRPGYP